MTAADIADMLKARRIGRDRWRARCPSHSDRHPSLSISQGNSGVLLRCWSRGCSIASITAALKLPMSALFDDRDPTPAQRGNAAQRRREQEAELNAGRAANRLVRNRLFRLEQLMNGLGAKLARSPASRELGGMFHAICNELGEVESSVPHHEDGPAQQAALRQIPSWIVAELHQVFPPETPRLNSPGALPFEEFAKWIELQNKAIRSERVA